MIWIMCEQDLWVYSTLCMFYTEVTKYCTDSDWYNS